MADLSKNIEDHRFEVHVDGELVGITRYIVGEHGVITLPHTEVDDEYAGQGLAGKVVRFALDDIRAEGYRVEPVCPFVQKWIGEHPDYADLVANGDSAGRDGSGTMADVTGVDPNADPRI